ncbi:hypothetical protein N7488_008770 [Penicillium malachiteum]|nr:hypothetical protein N7488_008770 [Penicillium malachiteum]
MSGMEIAGLALAILPLVVNQLENYVQGLETLGDFRTKRYRRKLDHYATNLGAEQAAFINTLERSLDGVIEYEDGVNTFGDDELRALWDKPSVQSLLQKKLGRNYHPFIRTMEQLSMLLTDLSRKLGWDKIPAKDSWDDATSFNKEVKKFKDIFSKTIYENIFDQINRANDQLGTLMEQSDYRSDVQKQRISKRPLQRLKRNRGLAQSLHKAILRGNSWKCACRDQHKIYFILDISPSERNEPNAKLSASPTRFKMVFSSTSNLGYSGTLTKAHEVETELYQLQPASTPPGFQHSPKGPVKGSVGPKKARMSVSFAVPDSCVTNICEKPPQTTLISDICLVLSAVRAEELGLTERRLLGCLRDGSQEHILYHLREINGSPKLRSLTDLLASSATTAQARFKGAFFLSPKDRLILAVSLASSVLELHGNWLKSQWRACDIMFIQDLTPGMGEPALALSVSNANNQPNMCREAQSSVLIRNEILFPLGLALIELSFCQPIDQLRTAEDRDENAAIADLKTACRLLPHVESQSGHIYADVVEQCLSWSWKTGYSLDDEDIQEEIYQRTVLPLAGLLQSFFGISL